MNYKHHLLNCCKCKQTLPVFILVFSYSMILCLLVNIILCYLKDIYVTFDVDGININSPIMEKDIVLNLKEKSFGQKNIAEK